MSAARVGLFVGLGVVAFLGGAGGALGARGRLNKEGLASLPVVGALVGGHAAAVDTAAAGEHGAPAEAEHGGPAAGEHAAPPPEGEGGHGEGEAGPHPTGEAIAQTFDLPRPFEADELEALVAKLKATRADYARRLEEQAALEGALAALSKELDARRGELDLVMQAISDERAQVERERAQVTAARVELAAGEEAALEPVARAYEDMQAPAAAARLALLDPDGAAKLLALMKTKKAAKVLENLPADQAAAFSARLAAIRRPQAEETAQ